MPVPFNYAVMTDAGAELLSRTQTGDAAIEFTRIATGDGTYTADEKLTEALQKATKLKHERNSYNISAIEVQPTGRTVKVTALITNQDPVSLETVITEGYYINEIALFAKNRLDDSEPEVMYSVTVTSQSRGDFMPPYNGDNPAQIVQDYFATVNNTGTVTIRTGGAALLKEEADMLYATIEDMAQVMERVQQAGDASATNTHDIAIIAFRLEEQKILTSDTLTNVCTDLIDTEDSVNIIKGRYKAGSVYI